MLPFREVRDWTTALEHLRASNISPRTIQTYAEAVRQLAEFLAARGMPTDVAKIKREHVESFIEDLLSRRHANGAPWKPTTAHNRYRGIRSFFAWLVAEGEIRSSPMERMQPPRLPEQPVPVLREEELRASVAKEAIRCNGHLTLLISGHLTLSAALRLVRSG